MRKFGLVVLSILMFLFAAFSQKKFDAAAAKSEAAVPSPSESSARFPVKRVVLYKNGVGYFEHEARVHGNQDLTIDFTTAQLNDVLTSLTAVDLSEERISSVRYNSIAPLDERLKALRLPFGEQVSRVDFLSALRGAGRGEERNGVGNGAPVERGESKARDRQRRLLRGNGIFAGQR